MKNKVGILYICTGKYSVFWDAFYENCEKHFLKNSDKHYFVWTDDEKILGLSNHNIHVYHQETEPWPFPTLKRFEYFLNAKEELLTMDYLVFMNGNLVVREDIDEKEFLPYGDEKIFVTMHPGAFDKAPIEFPYDNNPECHAYINKGEGSFYFAGGLNGGKAEAFIELMETLNFRTQDDYKKGIIALWHDESQINKYMYEYEKPFKILSPAYLYPEGWTLPFENKIMILDKNKHGGHKYLRGQQNKYNK